MPGLITQFQSTSNKEGKEPVPDSVLINDGGDSAYPVEAGKTYLFRILNIGAFPSFIFNIADHDFQVVEMDGVYTVPTTAKTLYIAAAMRYGILVTAKRNESANFEISAIADRLMFASNFTGKSLVVSGSLQYNSREPKPVPRTEAQLLSSIGPPLDDVSVPPLDGEKLLGPVKEQIVLNFQQAFVRGIPRCVSPLTRP
jgi:iron transport multicopper oxidase